MNYWTQSAQNIYVAAHRGWSEKYPENTMEAFRAAIALGVDQLETDIRVTADGELVLFSDRGYGKRVPALDYERQNRNGKGVRTFAFNKNGSNGRCIAGLFLADRDPCTLIVTQAQSPATRLNKDDVLLQSKSDRGTPYVMAILDDVVTGLMGEATVETGG